ncbi:MAG TPA: TonB C-terminal domain-containing protein, partial [Candidatus Melainabacteria bacterium]|nr:TonB C-terminal domain-containing protein [Candidatus Melainabacteria bacterium]
TLISGQTVTATSQTASGQSKIADGLSPIGALKQTPEQLADLEWVAKVKQRAKDNWAPDEPGNVVLNLGIKQDGKIGHLIVNQSIADVAFMRAAMDSCLMGEPYPLPPGKGEFVKEVEIIFEGNSAP